MYSSYSYDKKHAFVVNESELRKIWVKLEGADHDVKAIVKFNNNVETTVNKIDDLMSFENSKKRKILSVSMISTSKCHENRSCIKFESDMFRTVSISTSGDHDFVTKNSDELPEIVSGMKPWYSIISRLNILFLLYIPLLIVCIFAFLMKNSSDTETIYSFSDSAVLIVTCILLMFGMHAFEKLLISLKNNLFPVASFAIGQGVKRYETQDKFRFTVIVGFVVSVFASLFLQFIT